MTTLSVAIIGCGRIAQAHAVAVRANSHLQLVAACDVDETAARRMAQEFGGAARIDFQAMIVATRPDIAIVCTPPATHADITIACLEYGVHVLCEKPLALTVADAAHMNEAAQRTERVLRMASKFRFVGDVLHTRELITAGALGPIHSLRIQFCSPLDLSHRWNASPELSGGGVLMDNGPHAFDLARFLLGPLARVHAKLDSLTPELKVEDTACIDVEAQSGVVAHIALSWTSPNAGWYLEIEGEQDILRLGWQSSWCAQKHGETRDWEDWGTGYDKTTAFAQQLNGFLTRVNECQRDDANATATVAAITAAYASARLKSWQEI